ncbi:LPS O-antigen chain length determinant protein WzzB [Pseudomonas sp. NPDC089395]|uniref:LPS O-antigen chain length determinant protein WzzB n=1 Tax=Pseudomonas sp. NPDC089395 TaxID=3364460 RepID=UPI0037F7901F
MCANRAIGLPDDQDELTAFIVGLWNQKATIMIGAVLGGVLAAAYAFLSSPVYQATMILMPPPKNGIAELNLGRIKDTELAEYSVKDVYEVFQRNVQAESLRRDFFRNVYLPSLGEEARNSSLDDLYARYVKKIIISPEGRGPTERVTVSVLNGSPQGAVEWANAFVSKADAAAKKELVENVNREVDVRARNLGQQITLLRQNAKVAKEDRIVRLKEALAIAQSVGLEKPPMLGGRLSEEISTGMSGDLTYMRGTQALQAEIKNLEGREYDDPFLVSLRDLQMRFETYKGIYVNPDKISVFQLDGEIEQPDRPVKPQKGLIVAIGLLVGGAFGLLVALLRNMSRKVFKKA